jgi:thiol-disulfide isomerase/thioredoxin
MKFLLGALMVCVGAGAAAQIAVPHIGPDGAAAYAQYLAAEGHKVFAIAPGGAWGWRANASRLSEAEEAALETCQGNTQQRCVPYAVDGKVVFDARQWSQLWGPYASSAQARNAPVGNRLKQRFPDLAFADAQGHRLSLSHLRGKVVVLHFWGSWCGPCRRELPDLQKLYLNLKPQRDIVFVPVQVRESYANAQQWLTQQGFKLPVFDSGSQGSRDNELDLADGKRLRDREVATVFPSTYVIDKHGVVVFSHFGPVADWSQYRDFLLDAARRSGR